MQFRIHNPAWTRRGGAMFWFLLCLGAILGFLALLMDGGRMLEERRRAQAGADAAALAAAYKLYEAFPGNGAGDARTAALALADDNGFPNNAKTSSVTVNVPPLSGPFAGRNECVEVLIESRLTAGF